MTAEQKQWQAQSDLRTLTEAANIQADKTRMSAVKSHANAQVSTITKVTGVAPKAPARAAAKKAK